jgi:hypothetical protein
MTRIGARCALIVAKLAAARARLRERGEGPAAGWDRTPYAGLGAGRANANRYLDADLDAAVARTAEAGSDQSSAHDRDDDLGLGL